ncbi:MAG: hypothetical protein E6R05_00890 [Candidatus Moraniibacteriota bacterium]|nr:MAG: hypothetical protein E6R05_00890 [Candidatus Moranbacteria bacterium]
MKNTLAKLVSALGIVGIFSVVMTLIGVWLFRTQSVVPSFPYYYNLLLHTKDAAYALWGYFDGVHYLRLIENGYVDIGTQAFFPLYPTLVSLLSRLTGLNAYLSAVAFSLFCLFLALFFLWKLFPLEKYRQTIFLLLFPTSFFFISVYTESLFLLLSLAFFFLLKNEKYSLASVIAALASATRLVGVFLGLVLVWRLITRCKDTRPLYIVGLSVVSVSGFLLYMYFLWSNFGDPLMFLHVQEMFGANRSGGEIIMLPQVLYRYLKMIFTVDKTSFLYQRIWFELLFFLGALWAWYKNLKSASREVSLYVILSLLLPTLTGTLSSIPRYCLVLVPFLLPKNLKNTHYIILLLFSTLLMLYFFSHFAHGTFVA